MIPKSTRLIRCMFVGVLRRSFIIILIAFAASVIVRAPHLDRPLGGHHEYCTAVALIILHNWYADGYFAHHGNPIVSFTGPADRYPPGFADGPAEHDGLIYYFSHPPLAYDLPFALFRATGNAPSVIGLQLLNILFHLITAWCLFLAVREWSGPTVNDLAPLFAAILYLFMPAPLWFHGNVYMSDMFVQNFWVMHVVIAMRLFAREDRVPALMEFGFVGTLLLAVLTSWLGVFAAVVSGSVALYKWLRTKEQQWISLSILSVFAVVLALGFTAWRYTRVIEIDQLIHFYTSRFDVRGSVGLDEGVWPHLRQMAVNYRIGYLPLLIGIIALIIARTRGGHERIPIERERMILFLSLTGLPVIMDHVFLLQYADHDFTVLKAAPLLCGLAAYGATSLNRRFGTALVATMCVLGVLYYFHINPLPGSVAGTETSAKELGLMIADEALPDEAVFTLGFTPEPQVQWYAKRTLFRIDSLPEATSLLKAQHNTSGIVFSYFDSGIKFEHINQDKVGLSGTIAN